jgi:hypothetical protein
MEWTVEEVDEGSSSISQVFSEGSAGEQRPVVQEREDNLPFYGPLNLSELSTAASLNESTTRNREIDLGPIRRPDPGNGPQPSFFRGNPVDSAFSFGTGWSNSSEEEERSKDSNETATSFSAEQLRQLLCELAAFLESKRGELSLKERIELYEQINGFDHRHATE